MSNGAAATASIWDLPGLRSLGEAAAYCRKLTASSRSNFYYAFLFLPAERRAALEAVYAYCRLVDDVVDEDAPDAKKLEGLERWRDELEAVYQGANAPAGARRRAAPDGAKEGSRSAKPSEPPHQGAGAPAGARRRAAPDGAKEGSRSAKPHEPPLGTADSSSHVTRGLRDAISRYPIRREDMEAIIDGCAMDVERDRYATWDELRTYCYRVASAVGLMCIEIFGYSSTEARRYAIDLGIALQLTNIIRDVAEDARRGRIYLPKEDLDRFGVSEAELTGTTGAPSPNMVRLLRFQANRARAHYLRARAALGTEEKRRLVIAEIMGDIYFALLEEIEASDFNVFRGKATVRRRRKMAIALRNFADARLHGVR